MFLIFILFSPHFCKIINKKVNLNTSSSIYFNLYLQENGQLENFVVDLASML